MEFFLAPYPVGGTPSQGDPAKAPHVTVNSWGCPASEGCTTPNILLTGVSNTRTAGIVMEVSAGNSGSGCSTIVDPPSFYDPSFTTGALNTGTDTVASFSSRGPVTADGSNRIKPDIMAPGTSTRSSYRTSDTAYSSLSGTSMAGPHVAGGVALLLSAFPSLSGNVTAIESRLTSSAKPITLGSTTCSSPAGAVPNNVYGHGRLDLGCAVPAKVSGSTAVCSGSPATLTVDLLGTGPWTLTWSDGVVQSGVSSTPATRSVSPSSATTYSLTSVVERHLQPAGRRQRDGVDRAAALQRDDRRGRQHHDRQPVPGRHRDGDRHRRRHQRPPVGLPHGVGRRDHQPLRPDGDHLLSSTVPTSRPPAATSWWSAPPPAAARR